MLTATFVVQMHEEYGELGLKMIGRDWADPFGALAAVHDMMEHFPSDDGSVEHELMALGASLYVRDESSYYYQKNLRETHPAYHISSDMIEQSNYMHYWGRTCLKNPGKTLPLRDEGIEGILQKMYKRTQELLKEEFWEQEQMYKWTTDKEVFLGWFRRGYRRAQRRYKGISPSWLLASFLEGERQLEGFMKHAEEGMRCRLSINPKRAIVRLTDLSYDEE